MITRSCDCGRDYALSTNYVKSKKPKVHYCKCGRLLAGGTGECGRFRWIIKEITKKQWLKSALGFRSVAVNHQEAFNG